jgi:CIC family chloride channel protein
LLGGESVATLSTTSPSGSWQERRLIFEAMLLGVVGALSAQLFSLMVKLCQTVFLTGITGYRPPGLPEEGGLLLEVSGARGPWLIPLVTMLGGLISGVIVYTFAPEAEGHGTDSAIKAYHTAGGLIRARVPLLKMLASAITIGSGGAAGREGPTALIAAGVGSVYATVTRRTVQQRRLLLLAGMAAGLSAMFRSPMGAALFAIEVLYSEMELEAGALLYTMLASIVAYTVNGVFDGWHPLFTVPDLPIPSAPEHLWYVVMGAASGLVASSIGVVFYKIRDAFVKIPISPKLKPALGGLGLGILALSLPQVLGGGYGWIQQAIDGKLPERLLLVLLVAKIVALSLTISSGGSGGVFAPCLFVGAMLGAAFAHAFKLPPSGFVVVGMAAVFGGAARAPIATILMVTEMTGDYHLLPAAALAVTVSHVVQAGVTLPFKYKSLYEAQVPRRVDSPAHTVEHVQAVLRHIRLDPSTEGASLGRVELHSLLKSGIAVDLGAEHELVVVTLEPGSPVLGRPATLASLAVGGEKIQLLALIREERVILPGPETTLAAGDELLIAAPAGSIKPLCERVGLTTR